MSSELRIKRKRWHTDFNDEKLICTDTKYLGMERRFTLIELIFTDFKVLNNYRFILSYFEELEKNIC